MAKQVSFSVNAMDADTIRQIVRRAEAIFVGAGQTVDPLCLTMDITAVHANGCPLRLQALLDADEFNFLHDVTKIERHIDRNTGKLRDHFVPRFARRETAAA